MIAIRNFFKRRQHQSHHTYSATSSTKSGLRGGERLVSTNVLELLPKDANDDENNHNDQNYILISTDYEYELEQCSYGLVNLGNTCYLNSALQALLAIPGFCEELSNPDLVQLMLENCSIKSNCQENENDTNERQINTKSLYRSLLTVALELNKVPLKHKEFCRTYLNCQEFANGVVNPSAVKEAMDKITSNFIGFLQQDAHEFLTELIDRLHDEMEAMLKQGHDGIETDDNKDVSEEGRQQDLPYLNQLALIDRGKKEEEGNTQHVSPPPIKKIRTLSEMNVNEIENLLNESPNKAMVDSNEEASQVNCSSTCCIALKDYDLNNFLASDECVSFVESQAHDALENDDSDQDHLDQRSPLVELPTNNQFCTEINVSLTCDSCSFTRTSKEIYRHFSLDVINGYNNNTTSIDEGLRRFFAPQKLDLKCEKCFFNTATQTMEISKLAKSLLLHLKRFEVTITEDFEINTRKSLRKVEFEEDLDLSYYCNKSTSGFDINGENDESKVGEILSASDEDEASLTLNDSDTTTHTTSSSIYALRSVIHHIGSTSSCGHYTADALVSFNTKKGHTKKQWMKFNDSQSRKLRKDEVLNSQETAYLVMYEQHR